MKVEEVNAEDLLQCPDGAVSLEQVSKLNQTMRRVVVLAVYTSDAATFKVAVTDDHRMRLQHNAYRVYLEDVMICQESCSDTWHAT